MQLKCIQNTNETQWNKLHLPYPATEFFIPVAENKRRISDCDVGTGSKALDDGLLCSRRHVRLASVLQNGNSYRAGEANGRTATDNKRAQYQGPAPFPTSIKAFRDSHDKGEIRYVYFESPGTAYEWLTCRRDLYDFAPRLFS